MFRSIQAKVEEKVRLGKQSIWLETVKAIGTRRLPTVEGTYRKFLRQILGDLSTRALNNWEENKKVVIKTEKNWLTGKLDYQPYNTVHSPFYSNTSFNFLAIVLLYLLHSNP